MTKFEILPNEILFNIFSYLSWDKILLSFWSLNQRINSLIFSIFSNDQYEIDFKQSDLSYKIVSSILLPLLCKPSSLSSLIKFIHFDGTSSNSYKIIDEFLYSKQKLHFPNIKSLKVTQCLLSQSFIQILSSLIQNQLNELTLTFDEEFIEIIRNPDQPSEIISHESKYLFFINLFLFSLTFIRKINNEAKTIDSTIIL